MQDPRSSLALIVPPVEISRWERLAFVPTAALVFGFGIWIADLFVVYAGISPLRPEVMLRSAGTLLFFSALIGLGLAIPLTSLAALLTLRSSSAVESGRVPPSGPEAAGDALLLVALTGAYGVAFRFGGRALLRGVVRELFQAWGIVGLSFGLLAASALLFVVLRPSARALSIWLAPRPYVGWPWRHRASLLLSVGALALIASALAFLLRAGGGAIIPITDLLRVLFALLLGLGAALGARIPRARIWLLALICSLLVFALAGGGVLAFSLRSEDALARRLVFERGLSGRLAGRLTLALADPDDDGFAQVFGGGDCAPQDPSRHPMALELPENGIDEDCDGVDLSPLPLPPPATFAPPNGASIPRRPDLVLITVGEMSPRDLAAHGAAPSRMPRLDRRIEAGAYFDSCFAQGPATRLALPSLFSSRYDSELPRRRGPRPPYSTTCSGCRLAEHLQSLRFDTVAVISSAHLSRGRWPSLTGGFERIEAGAIRAPDRARRVTADVLRVFATRREKSLFVWAHYPSIEGSTDAAIEALIAGIQREAPEALIVLTGDHGRPLEARSLPPGPRRDSRGQDLHTATLHVPLLFLASWIPARRVSSPVSQLDIRPTLINLLRRHPSPQVRGESLVPAIFGSEPAHPLRPRFHERNLAERAWQPSASAAEREPLRAASVRTERWHLILDRDRRAWMLFDWREDYEERRDLLELEREPPADYPALRAMLQTFLLRPDPAPPPSRLLPPSVPRSAPVRPAAAARPTPAPADVRPEPE